MQLSEFNAPFFICGGREIALPQISAIIRVYSAVVCGLACSGCSNPYTAVCCVLFFWLAQLIEFKALHICLVLVEDFVCLSAGTII